MQSYNRFKSYSMDKKCNKQTNGRTAGQADCYRPHRFGEALIILKCIESKAPIFYIHPTNIVVLYTD